MHKNVSPPQHVWFTFKNVEYIENLLNVLNLSLYYSQKTSGICTDFENMNTTEEQIYLSLEVVGALDDEDGIFDKMDNFVEVNMCFYQPTILPSK